MSLIAPLLALFTSGVDAFLGAKKQQADQVISEQAARHGLRPAKLGAEQRRFEMQHNVDTDYAQKVLDNSRFSVVSEVIVAVWIGVFITHFIKPVQPYIATGWESMGHSDFRKNYK